VPEWQKTYKKLKRNPRGATFDEAVRLLRRAGLEERSVKGSHHTFSNGTHMLTIARKKPTLAPYAVKQVIAIFEELMPGELFDAEREDVQ